MNRPTQIAIDKCQEQLRADGIPHAVATVVRTLSSTAAKPGMKAIVLENGDFAEGWLAAGRVAVQFEDWGYALETLNTALTLEPRRYDAYLTLGRVLERAEETQAALEAYDAALEIYPAHEDARQARDRLADALAGRSL